MALNYYPTNSKQRIVMERSVCFCICAYYTTHSQVHYLQVVMRSKNFRHFEYVFDALMFLTHLPCVWFLFEKKILTQMFWHVYWNALVNF